MYAEPLILESPQWSAQAQRRLRISFLLSAACIAAMLLVLRFPVAGQAGPMTELFVQILIEEAESVVETARNSDVEEKTPRVEPYEQPTQASASDDDVQVRSSETAPVDWYALIPGAAEAAADKAERTVSANPVFDEKRRRAAAKFAPSNAPEAAPVWENVERDLLGRSILRAGDCYVVIDDPNVGSREAFETFGQYIAMCSSPSDTPRLLPWVSEIRSRRASQARSVPRVAE